MRPGTPIATSWVETRGASEPSPPRGYLPVCILNGIGTATPPSRYTKLDCWEAFRRSDWFERLSARTRALARAVLLAENGMEARRLAVDSLAEVIPDRPGHAAPALPRDGSGRSPARAGAAALDHAGVERRRHRRHRRQHLHRLSLSGTHGVCHRAPAACSPNTAAFDLVGQGCAAAVPNMRLGQALIGSGPELPVTSSRSASKCRAQPCLPRGRPGRHGERLSVWRRRRRRGALQRAVVGSPPHRWRDSESLLDPGQRETLKFQQRHGMLRNVLTRPVPQLAAKYAGQVLETVLQRSRLDVSQIAAWIVHAGGRDVLLALEERLRLSPQNLVYSAAVLREYGNLSSAFVYFVLQAALAGGAAGGWWWLGSFGAGFSCHGALLQSGLIARGRRSSPEILDDLPPADPRAIRSRRDLQRVNRVMGSCGILTRAIRRALNPAPHKAPLRLLELGAGDGTLALRIAKRLATSWPAVELTLLDRQALSRAGNGHRPRSARLDPAPTHRRCARMGSSPDATASRPLGCDPGQSLPPSLRGRPPAGSAVSRCAALRSVRRVRAAAHASRAHRQPADARARV